MCVLCVWGGEGGSFCVRLFFSVLFFRLVPFVLSSFWRLYWPLLWCRHCLCSPRLYIYLQHRGNATRHRARETTQPSPHHPAKAPRASVQATSKPQTRPRLIPPHPPSVRPTTPARPHLHSRPLQQDPEIVSRKPPNSPRATGKEPHAQRAGAVRCT